ncbi:MAG: EAL domain-containing protein [Halioglobus sp.]
MQLVAEGVETHEQYHFLRNHGASIIQGYLFSKPSTLRRAETTACTWLFQAAAGANRFTLVTFEAW